MVKLIVLSLLIGVEDSRIVKSIFKLVSEFIKSCLSCIFLSLSIGELSSDLGSLSISGLFEFSILQYLGSIECGSGFVESCSSSSKFLLSSSLSSSEWSKIVTSSSHLRNDTCLFILG
jgi:hypothetical protein